MANLTEPSSSLRFTSSYLSNGSSYCIAPAAPAAAGPEAAGGGLEVLSLNKLSSDLESLLLDTDFDCADAKFIVEGSTVGVHRCILAARSRFFRDLFAREVNEGGDRRKYKMDELIPGGWVGHEAFKVFLSYQYTGKLTAAPQEEVSVCADEFCAHDTCLPAIDFIVELMHASSVFQISELVSLLQRRLLNFVDKAYAEDVIPIVLVAFHSKLNPLLNQCIQRIARSDIDDVSLEKELPIEVAEQIRLLRSNSKSDDEPNVLVDPVHEKRIRRISRALDSDDVELVKLLLSVSGVTLENACALHYAVAYCDSKVVAELMDLNSANVNLKNKRGYTPLHVAAMRREPDFLQKVPLC